MKDQSSNHLQILAQLAQEYQTKYVELEKICQNAQPEWIIQQLTARGELTTDHFRAAQQALFAFLDNTRQCEDDNAVKAVTTISRCFDEMRILFSILIGYISNPQE
ncbi:hypothetical protein [Desulfoferrobacter suflitae]|uniref:hypothetical protein n=1 Tax=Desulfoferrobacter suflitae TaxID=2865782 RepID=UPI0021642D82|nr:hypothetical protein [Desulfoferrobacter suflitae]MCK8603869.1 hypothetical protein [Desulfoferrobacter suflitae]